MPSQFCHKHRIAFADTDLAGIVHFGNYFRYMELTEHAFLRALGLSVHAQVEGQWVSWPRVHAECLFMAPLEFDEEIQIHLSVREKTRTTITYDFRLLKEDGKRAAIGSLKVVCVTMDPARRRMASIPIPACIDQKIEVAPPERSEEAG